MEGSGNRIRPDSGSASYDGRGSKNPLLAQQPTGRGEESVSYNDRGS